MREGMLGLIFMKYLEGDKAEASGKRKVHLHL